MKGFLTLCSAVLALLKVVCIPAEAQDAEMTDTLARAVISSSRPAIASTGLKRFDGGELLGGAAILGSPDVVKFLQNLPGVASGMELMSGLYVRGGDGSDNLFMLDGVPLFQVSHLAGIFSSFNTDVIESLDFYESGFPARYGGRLSSIVDIRTKNGSMENFGGSVSVGLIDGRINLNGPIVRNKLSYDIAIRRSWLDALVAPVLAIENSGNKTKTNGGYALFDSNLNLTYTPGPRDILNLRFYMGSDNFNYSNTTEEKYYGKEIYYSESGTSLKMKWGNLAASAGLRISQSADERSSDRLRPDSALHQQRQCLRRLRNMLRHGMRFHRLDRSPGGFRCCACPLIPPATTLPTEICFIEFIVYLCRAMNSIFTRYSVFCRI